MPKRLDITKGFINNQNIDGVVGLNIAYSSGDIAQSDFPSAYVAMPIGIAFDKFGNFWVADNYRPAILMYPPTNQYNGAPATFIIGQPNFNVNKGIVGGNYSATPVQNYIGDPFLIAFDNNNNLWVYDSLFYRILGFKYPFGSGGVINASWVIGQPNFTSDLTGITSSLFGNGLNSFCFDNENNLWVSDSSNSRVLGFAAQNIYTMGGAQASWVIGQPNFTSNTIQTLSAKSLNAPTGISIDKNGNLWVADSFNNRVLGYSNPKSIMPTANYVIGQSNFTTNTYAVTQNEFSGIGSITQIAFDNNNNLYVYDLYRILGFTSNSLYGNNQPNASWLMFQPNYTSSYISTLSQGYTILYDGSGAFYSVPVSNDNIVAALPNPYQIHYGASLYLAFDSNNNIWISDTYNYRILQYLDPTQNAYPYSCNTVLAQSQYDINGASSATQYTLEVVSDIAVDNNKNIWCADTSRVVGYQYPNYNQQAMQNWVIGAPNFTTSEGTATQNGIVQPLAIAFDNYGNLFVADNWNRILGFSADSLYGNNQPNAFVVIGQSSYTTTATATTQNGLNIGGGGTIVVGNTYGGMAFDSSNNMYVCDSLNSRIMIFNYGTGFTVGMNASIVLGQGSFTTLAIGSGMANLSYPRYCVFDKSGNLWVSDTGNSRIQKFVPPFTIGMSASISITGFNGSTGIVFDESGNLLVADQHNNRILLFTPTSITATTTVASASIVLGQPDMTTITAGLSINKLSMPSSLAIDSNGRLLCCDTYNNRNVLWSFTHKATSSNKYNAKYIFYNE